MSNDIQDWIRDENAWFETEGRAGLRVVQASNAAYMAAVHQRLAVEEYDGGKTIKGALAHQWQKMTRLPALKRIEQGTLAAAETERNNFHEILASRADRLFERAIRDTGMSAHVQDMDAYYRRKMRHETLERMGIHPDYLERLKHTAEPPARTKLSEMPKA